jgi:lipid A 3-O-deacylase
MKLKPNRTCSGFLAAAAALLAGQAHGAESTGPAAQPQTVATSADVPQSLPGWYLIWENDAVAAFSGSDEFYTQGIQLGYSFDPRLQELGLAPASAWFARLVEPANSTGSVLPAATWYIGQHIFTPSDLSQEALIPDDRPYAGWFYAGARLDVGHRTEVDNEEWAGVYHTLELQLGVTGPHANGEWSQREFHKLIDDELPMGWDNQLPTEFGVLARYKWQRRLPVSGRSIEVDFWPEAEIVAGNVQTYAQTGGILRVGRNLGDPAAGTLTPVIAVGSNRNSSACLPFRWAPEECYLFAGASGRAVARNMFLDGTWSRESHSVEREPFVYDLKWGLRLRWSSVQVDYTFVHRSREFSPVPAAADEAQGRHDYGSVSVRCLQDKQLLCPAAVVTLLGLLFAQ